MDSTFMDELVDAVKVATAVLNDEEALEILRICKRAADREIANVTEEYIKDCINGGDPE